MQAQILSFRRAAPWPDGYGRVRDEDGPAPTAVPDPHALVRAVLLAAAASAVLLTLAFLAGFALGVAA